MYSHAYPNVLNERDPGRQRGAPVGIDPGSLSPHRALISQPPACLSSLSTPSQRQWVAHELCGHIDQLIESYCLEPMGHYWRKDYPTLVLCVHVGECITQLLVTAHSPLGSPQICNGCTKTHTRARWPHTAAYTINMAQMTACIDCLPSAIMFPLFTF